MSTNLHESHESVKIRVIRGQQTVWGPTQEGCPRIFTNCTNWFVFVKFVSIRGQEPVWGQTPAGFYRRRLRRTQFATGSICRRSEPERSEPSRLAPSAWRARRQMRAGRGLQFPNPPAQAVSVPASCLQLSRPPVQAAFGFKVLLCEPRPILKCRRAIKPKARNEWSLSAYARGRRHFESVAILRVAQRPAVKRPTCSTPIGDRPRTGSGVWVFGRF